MSARTLSRCNAFVRVRNKNSACALAVAVDSFSLSLSLCLACRFPLSSPCFRLRRVLCRLSCSLLLAQPLFAPISLVPIRLRFPLSTAPLSSPPLSTRLLDARSPEIYSLSLFLAPFLRGRPLVRCPSLPFSVLLAASTRNFLLSRSSWITSRRFSFFSRLPVLSRPLLALFFSIFVCILLHFSFSSTSLRSVVHSPPLSLPPLLVWTLSLVHFRVFPRPSVIARGLPVVSSSSWLPSTGLVRTHTFPYTGKFVHDLASSTFHTPVPLYLFSVFVAMTSLQPSSFTYSFAC